ncbi:MAG: hypothetical protein Q8P52_00090 [bacterium]|nr:hypothetical protein [bacterium]
MSQVEFNEQNLGGPVYNRPEIKRSTPLINLIIKLGAKDEKQANLVLMGIAITSLVLTAIIISRQLGGNEAPAPIDQIPPAEDILY